MGKNTSSEFRLFCTEKWFEHKDEVFAWTGSPVQGSPEQYFSKYRWFLKTLYLDQQRSRDNGSVE